MSNRNTPGPVPSNRPPTQVTAAPEPGQSIGEAELLRQRETATTMRNIAVGALGAIITGACDPKAVAARALNEIRQAYDAAAGR